MKLVTRLIVEETLEDKADDAVGRDYYEHGAQPGQDYRNSYRTGRLKTAEGLMEYSAPQIAGREARFRSHIRASLKGHTQGLEDLAIEMLARGQSVRDIEDAFDGTAAHRKKIAASIFRRTWHKSAPCITRHPVRKSGSVSCLQANSSANPPRSTINSTGPVLYPPPIR